MSFTALYDNGTLVSKWSTITVSKSMSASALGMINDCFVDVSTA